MKRFFKDRKFNILISALAVIAMWLIWIIAYYSVKNDYIIPSFSDSFSSIFKDCLCSGLFWRNFSNTFLRTLAAFAVSFALAAVLAVPGALFPKFNSFVKPFMVFLRTLPTLAVILILLIWTNPRVAPVIVTFLVLFPVIHARLYSAVDGIDGGVRQTVKVYGVKKSVAIFKVYLPLISPSVLSQTGADISLGLKIMISAEVLAGTYRSLGGMMQEARLFLEIPRLAALTLLAVFLGLIIDFGFTLLARLTDRWSRKESV